MEFSEPALYRHFGNKEAIIVTLLRYVAESMDQLYSLSLTKRLNPEQKFRSIFKTQFDFFAQKPHFAVAVFSDGLLEESQMINQEIMKIMTVKVKYLKPIIEEGQRTGVFTQTVNTDFLMHLVMGSIRLQMYKWRIENFQSNLVSIGDELIESLLKIIKQ